MRLDKKEKFVTIESRYKEHRNRCKNLTKDFESQQKRKPNPLLEVIGREIIESERALMCEAVHSFFAASKECALMR